jgi:hypothetical protein
MTSLFNASEEIQSACDYLLSNYNSSLGLIAETPSHQRYFLFSDNFLASVVLPKDCYDPSLANSIDSTLARYNPSKIPNQYMVLECRGPYFNGSTNYELSGKVWTTINNGTGPHLNDSYADIAFLQAYFDLKCQHNAEKQSPFDAGANLYDGVGFNDSAFRVGPSAGIYQTYKLALYIYIAALLNQTVPLSVLTNMMAMQNPAIGGFYTGYNPNHSINGTTNTETTCLAIMALEAAFG